MKKLLTIMTLLIFTSPICFAKGGGHKNHDKKIFKQLNLSAEQKKSLDTLRENKGTDMKALRDKKKELKNSMDEALMSDASESKLRSLHADIEVKMSSIQKQIKDKRFEKMLKIRSILTAEQRKTFFELKQKNKMKKRKHKRHDD